MSSTIELAYSEREKILTLYPEFHKAYLLILNEVLLQHFMLIFITQWLSPCMKSEIIGIFFYIFFNFQSWMPWPTGIHLNATLFGEYVMC